MSPEIAGPIPPTEPTHERLAREAAEATWRRAHEPAKCGHARVHWRDPKYGTPDYRGEEKCEVCEALRKIEVLERERDELKRIRHLLFHALVIATGRTEADLHDGPATVALETAAERDSLRARVEALEAALEPFAKFANDWPNEVPAGRGATVLVGDLRRARSVLSAKSEASGWRPTHRHSVRRSRLRS